MFRPRDCVHDTRPPKFLGTVGGRSSIPPVKLRRGERVAQLVKNKQDRVRDYVKEEVAEVAVGNLDAFKGDAISTLVYASVLQPDVEIIRFTLKRLLLEDERDLIINASVTKDEMEGCGDENGGIEEDVLSDDGRKEAADGQTSKRSPNTWTTNLSMKTTAPCVSALFGLTERSQRRIEQQLLAEGMVYSLTKRAESLVLRLCWPWLGP